MQRREKKEMATQTVCETYKNICTKIEGHLGIITINRPDKLNALNDETCKEIALALKELEKQPDVAVIALTGSGDKAFCAGADIGELQVLNGVTGYKKAHNGQELLFQIERLEKPVIAAINGFALGGGCELAIACDIRIASDKAKFGQPEVNLGIIPGFGGTQRLPRLVGKGKAMEMILTGDIIDANEALRIGLLNTIVPHDKLLDSIKEMAEKIATKGPLAIQFAKLAIHEGLQVDIERGCELEAIYFGTICSTEDKTEGTSAFLEKRKANFKGK